MNPFHAASIGLGLVGLFAIEGSADAQSILVLNGTGASSVSGPLASAGFTVVSGTLDPGQISSNLAANPNIVEIWIWNDGTYPFFDPTRDFDANDLADLDTFSATHPHWIMDSLAWRSNLSTSEQDLSMNEAIDLAAAGGGVVLGSDDDSDPGVIQHVNQVAAHVGISLWLGTYVIAAPQAIGAGVLLNSPAVVDLTTVVSPYSLADVPNGLQPNGLVLSTALFCAPGADYPGYTNPELTSEVINGVLYLYVDHLITTTIPSGGLNPIQAFCFPNDYGVMACPCGNAPANNGMGCDNSAATGGAQLLAAGTISVSSDSVQFTSSGEKPSATSIFLQGTSSNGSGVPFGQGLRCTSGLLKRLYVKSASSGVATAPDVGDLSVTARSASLGDTINAGETRYYQTYYRDPTVLGGCPSASTFNSTQGLAITWLP